jgi:TolB-like protein/DNA-binding winged helix-turn-helix (wHTH) protein/Tfp pilus assembly protein PilF
MPVSTLNSSVLKFDAFELNLRAAELRKGGVRLRLQGQPLQVLAILMQSAGELVTREELRGQLWPADTFVDFDHSLHNAVGRIREVLGDSAETPRYVETLPRRGYRFIAKVEEVPVGKPGRVAKQSRNGHGELATAAAAVGSKPRASRILAVALLACVAIAIVGWLGWQRFHVKSPAPIRSIAVLPMGNFSGDTAQEYFADGMTEELITELSRIQNVKVISRTSVMSYKGTKKHLPQIARELGVDAIVEGSVSREGDRVRVTVQLLDGPNDRHLWSEDYERELGGILSLQRDIAQAIGEQIRAKVTPLQQAMLKPAHAVNPEAYDAYLRGRFYMSTMFSQPKALKAAKGYFEEAIQKDPKFALSYVGLADSYVYLALFRDLSPQEAYRPATEALHKALELDSSVGEAHDTLAQIRWHQEWDWAGAEREFNESIRLSPNYDCAHADHSSFLSWRGRRDEAEAEITKSRELDPGYSFASSKSGMRYLLRDYPGLVEVSRQGVISDPNEWLLRYFLGVGYEGTGKVQEAIAEYQKAVDMSHGDQDATAALAHAYAVTGKRGEAEEILRDLQQKSKSSYVSPYMIATIYAGLGDKDKAFEYLEKAYQERCWDIVWCLKADLRTDNLRSDPRFQSLVQRVGLPQ